jgi:hypothetical protein
MSQHGGSRPGSGRKKGQTTKLNDEARRKAADGGLMPLDYLLSIMRNETLPQPERVDAAKAAAPYVHAKLANVELNASVAFSHEDALDELDDEPAREGDPAQAED